MKHSKIVVMMLICSFAVLSISGCGKEKKTETQTAKPTATNPAPVTQPTLNDPSGPIKVEEVFGDKFVDFSVEPTYQLLIACGNFDGYYTWFNRNCNESVTEENYGYSYAQPVPEDGSTDDVTPAYGRAVTLISDKETTVLQHYPYHPDFQAFKNWYDNKHNALMDQYNQASSTETVYDDQGNIVDLGVASSYYNQALQMESKYNYYLSSKIRKCYGEKYEPEIDILKMFEECYALSNFDPEGMCMGIEDLEFITDVYVNVTKYKLTSKDLLYTYTVFVDNATKKVIEIDKYLTDGGVDAAALAQIQIMYNISPEYQPSMPVVDDTNFAKLTKVQMDSLVKQVTCKSMPVFDKRYEVKGFNVLGMTSIASMFNSHEDLIAAELLKFGEDDGNFVNFDSVIWSSVDPTTKSVSCRFVYQDIPVSFTLTPKVVNDDNGNKKEDTYDVLVQTTADRNSNTWWDADDVTDEQKKEVYDIAYENLNMLKDFDVIPADFEFDVDAFTKWYKDKFGDGPKSDMVLEGSSTELKPDEKAEDEKSDEKSDDTKKSDVSDEKPGNEPGKSDQTTDDVKKDEKK